MKGSSAIAQPKLAQAQVWLRITHEHGIAKGNFRILQELVDSEGYELDPACQEQTTE